MVDNKEPLPLPKQKKSTLNSYSPRLTAQYWEIINNPCTKWESNIDHKFHCYKRNRRNMKR